MNASNKILVVEDDWDINALLCKILSQNGYDVRGAYSGSEAKMCIEKSQYDLIILDLMLPGICGEELIKEIRKNYLMPIIVESAKTTPEDKIGVLKMGADDFIPKPFDGSVLIAKIQALLRRAYSFGESSPVLEHRGAMLNTGDNSLVYQGKQISLSKNEYRILLELMRSRGKVVSRERLMEALWQTDDFVDENALTVNVGRLRKKLEAAGLSDFIVTKFGVGYLID